MNKNTVVIMEQLGEATNIARSNNCVVYVFREDENWFISGKMPLAKQFYIAYPNGQFDKSPEAPELTPEDWSLYWDHYDPSFRFVPAQLPSTKSMPCLFLRKLQSLYKRGISEMEGKKKILLAYAAFAPHLATAMAFLLYTVAKLPSIWSMAWIAATVNIPFSILFVLAAIHRPKDGRIAAVASTFALHSHIMFFGHLYYLSVVGSPEPGIFPVTLMASLMLSGVALLLLWDNDEITALP